VHEALPAASELERAWSRQAVRFMEQAQKREAGMSAAERRALLDLERLLEQPTRGFYGWGFVDRNPLRKGGRLNVTEGRAAAARYLARNVAGYLVENVQADPSDQGATEGTIVCRRGRMIRRGTGEFLDGQRQVRQLTAARSAGRLPGRTLRGYGSVRLTMQTGVTIRNLRRARYLWVCLTQGLELPSWPEVELERVWLLLVGGGVAAARAP